MHLIAVGHRVLSLEHLILVEHAQSDPGPGGPPPGGSRVTMEPGMSFDLDEAETRTLDRHLERILAPDPAEIPVAVSGSVGVRVDPRTGQPLPRQDQGGEGGGGVGDVPGHLNQAAITGTDRT